MKKMCERQLKEVCTDRFEIKLNMPTEYPPIKARPTEEGGVRDRFFAAKAELPDEITVIRPFNTDAFGHENVIYIAENGDDAAAGGKDSPVATLFEALARAEGKGGAKLVFRGGCYDFAQPANITSAHSGTAEYPLIITSEAGETAYLSSSKRIPTSAFVPVTDVNVLKRLKPEVQDKVLVADLASVGITNYGHVGKDGAQLVVNGALMDLARYPNAGEEPIVLNDGIISRGKRGDAEEREPWEFALADTRPLSWQEDDDIYVFGGIEIEYFWDHYRVSGFDREKNSVKGDTILYSGLESTIYNKYFFENIFEELDAPGEWYLDRKAGLLYLYPENGALSDCDDVRLLVENVDIIRCDKAENVIIDRLDIGRCGGVAISVKDCTQVLIQRCHITGTKFADMDTYFESAVEICEGFRNGVIASKFEHFTNFACRAEGGNRRELIPANNFVQNCIFENPKNRMALISGGCGNVLSHNYLHNTTINDNGHNEGIVEYNVLEGMDTEGHDSGAIYVGGGGCSFGGNHYRYNYFFDFAECDYGIYFDDMSRGLYAYGNIVVGNGTTGDGTEWYSGGRSYNHHNGGEHVYFNNISIDAGYFAFGGDVTYWLFDSAWDEMHEGFLASARDKRTEKYMGRYPTYKDFVKDLDQFYEDIKDPNYKPNDGAAERRLRSPWCNNYENNLIVRAARPYKLDHGIDTATSLETNFITDDNPGFVDFEGKDYRFREDAVVYEKIPDFVAPPFEKMGLVDDFAD